jgi:hypothetical protein
MKRPSKCRRDGELAGSGLATTTGGKSKSEWPNPGELRPVSAVCAMAERTVNTA